MPPKKSDSHHITFHFWKSAVLLTVPASTTISSLKSQLLPALEPLKSHLPISIPKKESDIRLYEDETKENAPEPIKLIESSDGNKSIGALEWSKWKKVYVSFRGEDGKFSDPEYTVPDVQDEQPEEESL